MGILERMRKVLESNLNALVERAEDPAKMLDQAIEDMKRGRNEARQAIIDAKTQKRLLEKKRDKAVAEAQTLERKAMAALKANDENLARRFLEMKISAEQRRDAEDSAVSEQENQIRQLDAAEKELERRLAEMPAKRAALLARQSTAVAKGARVGATSKAASSVASALEAFERMEEKVIRAEVEAEVVSADRGGIDIDTTSIDNMGVEEQLKLLKAKMVAQLPSGQEPKEEPPPAAEKKPDPVEDSLADLKAKLSQE
jgi:phage shock protein A